MDYSVNYSTFGTIQDSCERRVYQHFFINKDGRKLEELTAESMLEAVKLVRSDLAEQVTTYTKAFPNGFSLPQVTAPVYYRLVCTLQQIKSNSFVLVIN